ncbi:hypothetical protein [Sporosalibacterium faouarense]|uniref:hypothetical protein n=1 Tax=Sporosalibacterium faouarense TaxID=516123 RepID=UPI00192B8435|nr:hypothetical protein [Sporosalibacterium faouarense]
MTDLFKKPKNMRREDGTRKYAFVTFIMMNDSFLPGGLMLAYGLRKQNLDADIICMVTEKISDETKEALEMVYDYVIEVNEIFVHHKRRQKRQDRPFLFTRFHSLRLGKDGDLGFNYEKIVMLDSDVFPMRNYDHLFTLDTPAGTVNEKREYCLEYDDQGNYILPDNVMENKKWKWHEVYDDICPHGSKIPADICNRVKEDPSNMGVNSSLLVLTPSVKEFNSIMEDIQKPEVQDFIGDVFNWPEMQYISTRWAGDITNVDLIFNGFGGYPDISILYGLHYAGFKPWSFKYKKKIYNLGKHIDFQFWYVNFINLVTIDYPQLMQFKKIRKLLDEILDFQRYLGKFEFKQQEVRL